MTILVMGVDARPGEGYLTRTDSIMLVGLKPAGFRASLLSIPRDLMISVPYYGSQRINTINMLGEQEQPGYGPDLLSQSIALSFGVQPDRYVRLNFEAFVDLIDAVGGVTIEVDRAVIDYAYPTADYGTITVQFDVGREHMNGERALQYARTRHSDDDYFRAGRQQQVFRRLQPKIAQSLALACRYQRSGMRHIDTDLSPFDMIAMAPVVLANAGGFDQMVIDRDYIRPVRGGASPDYEKLAPWIDERFE